MKVTQDACVFGALIGAYARIHPETCGLDIGSGTGLLAMMLAQSGVKYVDAVEIDSGAADEAKGNVARSPFARHIHIHQSNILDFAPSRPYQLIVSNPPFFSNGLKGPDDLRNQARHNDCLSFAHLCRFVRQHLAHDGEAWLLLPTDEMTRLSTEAAQQGLQIQAQWLICNTLERPAKRAVARFVHASLTDTETLPIQEQTLVVRDKDGEYSAAARELLQAFYLKL